MARWSAGAGVVSGIPTAVASIGERVAVEVAGHDAVVERQPSRSVR